MKLLISLKSLWNSSLFRRSLLSGIALWLFLQAPLLLFAYGTSLRQSRLNREKERSSVEQILTNNLAQNARFGDFVNSRMQSVELGKLLGLKDIALCEDGRNISGKLFESDCPEVSAQHQRSIVLNNKNLTIHFVWQPATDSITAVLGTTSIVASLLSLAIVTIASLVTYLVLSVKVRGLANDLIQISANDPTFLDTEKEPEFLELRKTIIETHRRLQTSAQEIQGLRSRETIAQLAEQVAHDIRSPISVIRLVVSTLTNLPEEKRALLENSAERVNDIANDLLRTRRLNRGSHLSTNPVDRNESLESSFEVHASILRILDEKTALNYGTKSVSFVTDFRAVEGLQVRGQESEFSRALSNVVNNALEAIPSNGEVKIATRSSVDSFTLIIKDDGIGMSENAVENFNRLHSVPSSKENGSGLGLSYAYEVVTRMNGKILLQSREQLGTMVTITLNRFLR